MALHPGFPSSPYVVPSPVTRWFPADESLRSTAYEKLLPPLVAKIREEVSDWRDGGYGGVSPTSRALLNWWFHTPHLVDDAHGMSSEFRYYFAQREAVETIMWLYDVRGAREKFDLMRFDASGAVSAGMFPEDWPRYVCKMATGAGKTKVLSLLIAWSYFHRLYEPGSQLARNMLLIAPNIIVLDRLCADFDGLKIFFNDPVLPDNGFEGHNWRDDFQITLHIQNKVHIVRPVVNLFLTNIHRVYLSDVPQAKSKGIDLTPKYIPAEVFDKRAVERGQVVFHDISFVEATPRYAKGRSAHHKLTLQIELTEFSVYYTQGAADAALAALKEDKSQVICEQGQLLKRSKSKDGAVKREVLTRQWTDWVDYWAVDFDYMSRLKIIRVPVNAGIDGVLPGFELPQGDMPLEFEERRTGGYIFENEWQSCRTRKNRELDLITAEHSYERGRYQVAVKVVDIFGNDTMTLVPVNVG